MGACEGTPHNVALLGVPKTMNSGIASAKRAGRLSSQNCFASSRGHTRRWALLSRLGLAPTCLSAHVQECCSHKMYFWLHWGWLGF